MAALAVPSGDGKFGQGNCDLYVQYVDQSEGYGNNTIVLGSLVLSQLDVVFENFAQNFTQYMNMTVSSQYAMPLTYIGSDQI